MCVSCLFHLGTLGVLALSNMPVPNLQQLTNLTYLDMEGKCVLTDQDMLCSLRSLPNFIEKDCPTEALRDLELRGTNHLQQSIRRQALCLKNLNLEASRQIHESGSNLIDRLSNLTLQANHALSDSTPRSLVKFAGSSSSPLLTTVSTAVLQSSIRFLTGLTHLNLCTNAAITDSSICLLTYLSRLDMTINSLIAESSCALVSGSRILNGVLFSSTAKLLTSLTSLDICRNNVLTNSGFHLLTNLTHLDICFHNAIMDANSKLYQSLIPEQINSEV